jgi:hypothetical protein
VLMAWSWSHAKGPKGVSADDEEKEAIRRDHVEHPECSYSTNSSFR